MSIILIPFFLYLTPNNSSHKSVKLRFVGPINGDPSTWTPSKTETSFYQGSD